jgi:hypothetical protein
MEEQNFQEKRIRGYKVIVIVLAAVLLLLSVMFVLQVGRLRDSRAILTEQRDTLVSRLSTMMTDFDDLQTENDTINTQLETERLRADSLMDRLRQERNWSAGKIRQYEKELGTLRLTMQGYVRQIDSLNTLAQNLSRENVEIRGEVNRERLRADMAEERASDLDVKVRRGAMILAREIRLIATNRNGNEVSRAGRATGLRTDLMLTANELAQPGEREVFVRILDPNGYVLAAGSNATVEIDGERISYSASRAVDYQNQDLAVTVYYSGGNIVAGKYTVLIYMDGAQIGSTEVSLK